MSDTGRMFGEQLLAKTRAALGDEWGALPGDAQEQITAAILDVGELVVRSAAGEDVAEELALARATVLDWTFVGSSRAQAALEAAAREALAYLGKILLAAVAAAI